MFEFLRENKLKITPTIKEELEKINIPVPSMTMTLEQLLKRPEFTMEILEKFIEINYPEEIKEQVSINLKYEGYIERQIKQVEEFKKLESKIIPESINYEDVNSLRLEAREKLKKVKPESVGQASRISGVSPSDISVLLIHLSKYEKK